MQCSYWLSHVSCMRILLYRSVITACCRLNEHVCTYAPCRVRTLFAWVFGSGVSAVTKQDIHIASTTTNVADGWTPTRHFATWPNSALTISRHVDKLVSNAALVSFIPLAHPHRPCCATWQAPKRIKTSSCAFSPILSRKSSKTGKRLADKRTSSSNPQTARV